MSILLPTGEKIPVEKIVIEIEDGRTLQGSMLLDKDGNETEIMFDAVKVLCKSEEGWYEVDIQEGSWELPTAH